MPDESLAHVTGMHGSWLRVVTVEGRPVDGWVDDFFLRGVVHLVGPPPACRARVDGRLVPAGLQVVVRTLRGSEVPVSDVRNPGVRGWAPRRYVQELGPHPPGCGDDPPGSSHQR